MKKRILLVMLFAATLLQAQNNASSCSQAYSLCGALGDPFLNTTNSVAASVIDSLSYGCLGSEPNPAWFYLPVSQDGQLNFGIAQYNLSGTAIDVDFIAWGPFDGPACGPENLNSTTQIGCSYSASAFESLSITNAIAGKYYMILVTNYSNQPGYITITNTNAGLGGVGAINCSGIHLNAFLDTNGNGAQETGEPGFPYGSFQYEANSSGDIHNIGTATGSYTIFDEDLTNTYDVSYQLPAELQGMYACASTYTSLAVEPAMGIVTYNFPVSIINPTQDAAVYLLGSTVPMPGFTYNNTFVYGNLGNQPIASGAVTFTLDPALTLTSVSDPAVNLTSTGFTLPYTNLLPFEHRIVQIATTVATIPTVALGQVIINSAIISYSDTDINTANDSTFVSQEVVGSFDPNDITESHGRQIVYSTFAQGEYLYYTVRFQNTGTASAINVNVNDLLDDLLDETTVEVLSSSHDYVLDRVGNSLNWKFGHVMLPASSANEAASHGYVYYRVKPKPGYVVGTIIPNTANIYFDFNPAIVTNTFTTEFTDGALTTGSVQKGNFSLYPNPAKNTVNITAGGSAAITAVKIYDLTGKVIYTTRPNLVNSLVIDTSAFAAGTYFTEVTTGNSKEVRKLLIK